MVHHPFGNDCVKEAFDSLVGVIDVLAVVDGDGDIGKLVCCVFEES